MKKGLVFRLAFNASWRLAVLLLPWQTRWFLESDPIAGWVWEFGRISIYASWIPLIFAIFFSFLQSGRSVPFVFRRWGGVTLFALVLCTLAAGPVSISASLQWWTQVGLLIGFFCALYRQQVRFSFLAKWVVIGLVPHAVLGIWQALSQTIVSSTLLGIAKQDPVDLGVSVVQTSQMRFLRAYGGFPHPNIFGGWMATGLLFLFLTFIRSTYAEFSRFFNLVLSALCLVLGMGLFFSFSRSAWLAFAIGMIVIAFHVWRSRQMHLKRRFKKVGILLSVLFLFLGFVFSDLVAIRLGIGDTGRLEQKSTVERMEGYKLGWDLFRVYPFFGTGPNGDLPALARLSDADQASAPLEPSHNVFLLALMHFGIVGSLVLGLGFFIFLQYAFTEKRFIFFFFLMPLFFFDHYLWTTWSGHFLVGISLLAVLDA